MPKRARGRHERKHSSVASFHSPQSKTRMQTNTSANTGVSHLNPLFLIYLSKHKQKCKHSSVASFYSPLSKTQMQTQTNVNANTSVSHPNPLFLFKHKRKRKHRSITSFYSLLSKTQMKMRANTVQCCVQTPLSLHYCPNTKANKGKHSPVSH